MSRPAARGFLISRYALAVPVTCHERGTRFGPPLFSSSSIFVALKTDSWASQTHPGHTSIYDDLGPI